MEEKSFRKTLRKKVKLLILSNFRFFTIFSLQSVSKNPLIATFQLLSAASLNLGRSQNGVRLDKQIVDIGSELQNLQVFVL